MSSNKGKFANNFFTQINGATTGGSESASVTNIFGAVYIDSIANNGGGGGGRGALYFQQTGKGKDMIQSI